MTREQFDKLYLGKAVHCESEELADEFLKLARQFDYYRDENPYNDYKENTCFRIRVIFGGRGFVGYCDLDWYKNQGYKIVEFKSMKTNWTVAVEDITLEMLPEVIRKVLEVEVGEEFYGEDPKVRYRLTNDLELEVFNWLANQWVLSSFTISDLITSKHKIIKHLLTIEEQEFLSNFEFVELEKETNYGLLLYIDQCTYHVIGIKHCKHKFNGLEKGKHYTLKELGL